jgi:hypothetical protein
MTTQYSTIEEWKMDILETHMDLEDQPEMLEKIFAEEKETAEKVYFLVDKKGFFVLMSGEVDDETPSENLYYEKLYECLILCDDEIVVEKLVSVLQRFKGNFDIVERRSGLYVYITGIEKRSYLYLALFESNVVTWIYRTRKLI